MWHGIRKNLYPENDMTPVSEIMKVALVPFNISWNDKAKNLSSVAAAFERLHPATDLVILPETFSTGFPSGESYESVMELAEETSGETMSFLQKMAREKGVAVAGSYIARDGDRLFNRGFFILPEGEISNYDKRHLFTMAGENKVFTPGNDRMTFEYKGWKMSMVICYDIRFPFWCRNVANEYDVLIVVANWPEVRVDAWHKLLYARAIENLAYVCAVDCRGIDSKGFSYDGSTHVIDFKGKDIGVADDGIVYADLSRQSLDRFREKFPAWADSDLLQ